MSQGNTFHKPKAILDASDVTVQFGGFKAIDNFSFSIERQEIHFLIGPNGAGKTTFLDVVCGKTASKTGKILFGNEDLTKKKEFQIVRSGVGRKFQAPSIFTNLSVADNLELAMEQDKRLFPLLKAKLTSKEQSAIKEMLELINLKSAGEQEAGTLSHGQKQWLEIGMVMIQQPRLVLLDEPIAGMTEEEEEKTGELLLKLKKKCAILVVEHNMDFVRSFSEKVTVMHQGQRLCDGTMEEIQENEQVMDVYLGRQRRETHA
ncbi:urea ABC transporter ATP-binding protein UrtD [Salicibibacter cibi]|uniref:Urea ABC transporter ATP-binding protein UrtD n=1 Tax=Salicibibacter cibi TaxID=2743001 RepID=A0A7T6ZCS8_9BACI|nr:urea ABC transporter ATP-binding protein UrtD [Salicibibacter cibi]QQK81158.1 urea ABC transporter ATP-binding protein UrtD [Salicibibacter cibi]